MLTAEQKSELEEYDWHEALAFASFSIDEIDKIIAKEDGENDGDEWIAVFRLKDGKL